MREVVCQHGFNTEVLQVDVRSAVVEEFFKMPLPSSNTALQLEQGLCLNLPLLEKGCTSQAGSHYWICMREHCSSIERGRSANACEATTLRLRGFWIWGSCPWRSHGAKGELLRTSSPRDTSNKGTIKSNLDPPPPRLCPRP